MRVVIDPPNRRGWRHWRIECQCSNRDKPHVYARGHCATIEGVRRFALGALVPILTGTFLDGQESFQDVFSRVEWIENK